jgi:cation:H+ antiporter
MEEFVQHFIKGLSTPFILLIIAVTIYTLAKGADLLVDEAVILSLHWGVPKMLIGATIISLGTTLPEAAVSVLAAIKGEPGLALGNAVGSIICDTGLILGTAALISPLPLTKKIVNRQGWIQLGAGFLLVISCIRFSRIDKTFTEGGNLPQFMGIIFVGLLIAYIWTSIQWVKNNDQDAIMGEVEEKPKRAGDFFVFIKMGFAFIMVVGSSWILIPAVQETATRFNVPEGIIAATLVAFGTSLPEFVTAVTAVRKGHGELAVGNVIGADILNVLFVAGLAAAVTKGGLDASAHFFRILFPAMLFILLTFRAGIFFSGSSLKRPFGFILISSYIVILIVSYTHKVI